MRGLHMAPMLLVVLALLFCQTGAQVLEVPSDALFVQQATTASLEEADGGLRLVLDGGDLAWFSDYPLLAGIVSAQPFVEGFGARYHSRGLPRVTLLGTPRSLQSSPLPPPSSHASSPSQGPAKELWILELCCPQLGANLSSQHSGRPQTYLVTNPGLPPSSSLHQAYLEAASGIYRVVPGAGARLEGSVEVYFEVPGRLDVFHQYPYEAAVFLNDTSRELALELVPPWFDTVLADHMTLAQRPSLDQALALPLGQEVVLEVEGAAADNSTQALVIKAPPPGLLNRKHGPLYITISIAEGENDRSVGEMVALAEQEGRMEQLEGPVLLQGRVGVLLGDGAVAYTQRELLDGMRAQQRYAPQRS